MSKRKRAAPGKAASGPAGPAGEDSPEDSSVKDDMVHVTPDILAGSPDVFSRKGATPEPEAEAAAHAGDAGPAPEAAGPDAGSDGGEGEAAPPAEVEPASEPAAAEDSPPSTSAAIEQAPAPETPPTPPAAPPPPAPFVHAAPQPAPSRRGGSSAALGIVLVVVGIFALAVVVSGVDLTQYGWPLFVIVPGLTLLVVGFFGVGSVATIPGGIVTVLGLVLAYQNSTNDWPSWAYAWALVLPGGVGLGMYLQALRDRDQRSLATGRTLMFIGLMIFIIGFVFFESILGISGRDYGVAGKAALPVLLIIIGVILLVRSIQRARRA